MGRANPLTGRPVLLMGRPVLVRSCDGEENDERCQFAKLWMARFRAPLTFPEGPTVPVAGLFIDVPGRGICAMAFSSSIWSPSVSSSSSISSSQSIAVSALHFKYQKDSSYGFLSTRGWERGRKGKRQSRQRPGPTTRKGGIFGAHLCKFSVHIATHSWYFLLLYLLCASHKGSIPAATCVPASSMVETSFLKLNQSELSSAGKGGKAA